MRAGTWTQNMSTIAAISAHESVSNLFRMYTCAVHPQPQLSALSLVPCSRALHCLCFHLPQESQFQMADPRVTQMGFHPPLRFQEDELQ